MKPPTILLADDSPDSLAHLVELLRPVYQTRVASGGQRALELARRHKPDLLLLDIEMPDLDGLEVARQLLSDPATADLPIVFLTTHDDDEHERIGFECGAVDFIRKPVRPRVLLARVATHLALKQTRDALRYQASHLEQEVERRTQQLSITQEVTILAMASIAETRDNETGNHIRRTQLYVLTLARYLSGLPDYEKQLDPETIRLLYQSAPLHDIGKVGIPDSILLKPAPLTPEEWVQMKKHTLYGRDAIARAEERFGTEGSFLRFAREIAGSHHEKWDGSGYPEGLAGEAIPLSGRLMAVADVYDALISARVYKAAFPHPDAVQMIQKGRGTHFDPAIVDAFLMLEQQFAEIAAQWHEQPLAPSDHA